MNNGQSVITKCDGKELSKGCQSCKEGTWWCLYVGHRCNLDCVYCPQGTTQDKRDCIDHPEAMQRLWIDDIKMALASVKPGTIKGVSYSGGEPLMYLHKILSMASHITAKYPDIYQWHYTNGLLVTEDILKQLSDSGLSESRFHLGATNFDEAVVKKLEYAVKIMDFVNVETPSNPEAKEWFIKKDGLKRLADIGITQINCSEQYFISPRTYKHHQGTELYTYSSMVRGSHISPTFSREITYDIIDYVIQNNIDIKINDCSHESRDSQIMTRELNRDRLHEMY